MDNIKFEVQSVSMRIQTLGKKSRKEKKKPPLIIINIRDIQLHSTNSDWEVEPPLRLLFTCSGGRPQSGI